MFCKLSCLSKNIEVKFKQLLKHSLPKVETSDGIVTDVIPVLLKQLLPKLVTDEGIVIDVNFVLLKQLSPKLVAVEGIVIDCIRQL